MTVLTYIIICVIAMIAELYPMFFPAKTLEEADGYVKILQVTVFCLFLFCSWFYGRM